MTASFQDVRTAAAKALNAIQGLRATPYITDQVNPPHAMLDVEGPVQTTFSDGGAQTYTLWISVFGQRTSERASQQLFDRLRDPFDSKSIKRALEDSTDLDGLDGVDFTEVGSPGRVQTVEVGAAQYLMVEWPVTFVIHQETT